MFNNFKQNKGQAMVEYILVAAILFVAAMGAMKLFKYSLSKSFNKTADKRAGIIGMYP